VETATSKYDAFPNKLGCYDDQGSNLGFIDSATNILGNGEACSHEKGMAHCVELGQKACDKLISEGKECWGYAVRTTWVVQVLNSKAVNKEVCDKVDGLLANDFSTIYQRTGFRVGDCQCVSGYKGSQIWQGSDYSGACTLGTCPENSECSTTVDCNKGYKGSAEFKWNFAFESWEGKCTAQDCPANSTESFPECSCAAGYSGSHPWDEKKEEYTGVCEKVECPSNSDDNFPTCKCKAGFVRSDGKANSVVQWDFTKQEWIQTCSEVPCPGNSDKSGNGECGCRIGHKGKPEFDMETATYSVKLSGDFKKCVRIPCPADSTERGVTSANGVYTPSCKCNNGWNGELNWNPSSWTWGSCSIVSCPLNSHGHPYCACNPGFGGEINWDGEKFVGSCRTLSTTPSWEPVSQEDVSDATCVRLRGCKGTMASPSSDPVEIDLKFGACADVALLRCDIKVPYQFSRLNGTFTITPTTTSKVLDNYDIKQWNSSYLTTANSFVAVGTPYNLVIPGMQGGASPITYTAASQVTVPDTPVTLSDTIRFEVAQPTGVEMKISAVAFNTYNQPNEIVKCTRTSSDT